MTLPALPEESFQRVLCVVAHPDVPRSRPAGTFGVLRRSRETGPAIGPGGAEVLFDPARPGDEKAVFVALRRYPVPADWLPAQ